MSNLDDLISRLYSLPAQEFTEQRDALARRLRSDGDRDGAAKVRKLQKPNLPAWAINQAVRSDPRAAKALVKAGERLAEAQTDALQGKGRTPLREAMSGQGEAVEEMMRAVEEALGGSSAGAGMLDRARETLRAVASDAELRAQFEAGRLTHDREAVGFGGTVSPPTIASKRKRPDGGAEAKRRREAEQKARRAERALGVAARKAEEAQSKLLRAEAAAEAAREGADDAERDRAAREAELADARAVVAELSD